MESSTPPLKETRFFLNFQNKRIKQLKNNTKKNSMELRDCSFGCELVGDFQNSLDQCSVLSSVCMSTHPGCTPAVQEGSRLLENLLPGRKQEEKLESQSEWSWRLSCLEYSCAEEKAEDPLDRSRV